MTSLRTTVRDALLDELSHLKTGGRVREFGTSVQFLAETEAKQQTTYCVLVTDERLRHHQSQQYDAWDMSVLVVIWAYDTKDPRAKLDACIEDVIDATRRLESSRDRFQKIALEGIQTDESPTASGDWAQAKLTWTLTHTRASVAIPTT